MKTRKKLVRANCLRLADSGRTFEDIYRIVFSDPDAVMTEDASLVGRSRYRTYGQVQAEGEAIARGIFALTGKTGQYIGLYAENAPQWFSLFWGILQSGNHPYLINLRQPAEFANDALNRLNASAVVYLDDKAVPVSKKPCFSLKALCDAGKNAPLPPTFGNAFALSTSGTTLSRKICIYTGQNISAQILNILDMMDEAPGLLATYKGKIKHLMFLPLYHIFGLEAVFLWYSFWGSTFVFPPDMTPDNLLRTVRNHDVTHIFAVPLFWSAVERSVRRTASADPRILKKLERGLCLSLKLQNLFPPIGKFLASLLFSSVREQLFGDSVRFCISGGSAIQKGTLAFVNGLGYHLSNGYGMSEVGISSLDLARKPKHRINGTLGCPLTSVEYRINPEGHLEIRGASVCERIIVDGIEKGLPEWFDTGDLMTCDNRGRYTISGRASDLVFGEDGENLNPDLAEQAFSLTSAKNFCILGDETNESLMMVVQISQEMPEEQRAQLQSEIHSGEAALPSSYRIRSIRFTSDPIMGAKDIKVSRARLRQQIQQGTVRLTETPEISRVAQATEESDVKQTLRRLFEEILGVDGNTVPDRAHFMNDLGASSLDYFSLIAKIDESFGVTLEYETEQSGYCLADFERIIQERINR